MKKIIILLLTLLFSSALLLVGCDKTPDQDGKKPSTDRIVLSAIEDLSEYTIVRHDGGIDDAGKAAASRLRQKINESFGVDLKISLDSKKSDKEILLGNTSREESKDAASDADTYSKFVIKRAGNKIVIVGGSDEALMNAIDFWVTRMTNKSGELCVPLDGGKYIYAPEGKLYKITVEGAPLSEYTVFYADKNLLGNAERLAEFLLKNTDIPMEVTAKESDGKQIKLQRSTENALRSSLSVVDGNIVIEVSGYDADWSISHISELLKRADDGKLDITSALNAEDIYEIKPVYDKTELLSVLGEVYASDNVIIGTELVNSPSMVSDMLAEYYEATGEYPGILGLDVRYSNLAKLGEDGIQQVVAELTGYAQNGGIVTMSAHFANPHNADPSKEDYRGTLGGDDAWAELITDGTALNTSFMEELSAIADFLAMLRDNKVPVIWRPLHETNGNFFWFCMVQNIDGKNVKISEESFKNLWIYIHDYFTKERGLDNLLWEFGPNIGSESASMTSTLYGFPGKEYVDICGLDWYASDDNLDRIYSEPTYTDLQSLDLIINLNEFGPSDDMVADLEAGEVQADIFSCEHIFGLITEMNKNGYKIAYLLTWTDQMSVPGLGKGDILMQSEIAIGQAELYAMFTK